MPAMVNPMSAHSSFVYLVENIPTWQREVNTLAYRAHVKNGEFAAEYTRLLNQVRPRRKKSPSISSINPKDLDLNHHPHASSTLASNQDSDSSSVPLDRVEIDPFEAGNKYLYAQARRKRKPGASIRSGASGPQKFRNKNQVVVYYDGFLQDHLDNLVRMVGNGRNNLRKGKNSLVAARGFRLPGLSRTAIRDLGASVDPRSRSVSASLTGKQKDDNSSDQDTPNFDTTFLQVDKELDSIQSLCEVAAHQFLRDGDCQTEMDLLKQKLKDLQVRAQTTADALLKFDIEQQSKKETSDCSHSDITHASDSDLTLSTKPSLDFLHTPKLGIGALPATGHLLDNVKPKGGFYTAPGLSLSQDPPPLVADDIEVDDESEPDDFIVDIASYRLATARRTQV